MTPLSSLSSLSPARLARSFTAGLLIASLSAPAFAAGAPPPAPDPSAAPAPAAADTAEAEAAALKAKGDALFRARNYVDAVAAYQQAQALHPDPRVLYNEGRALQALGRNGEALSALQHFSVEAPAELRAQVSGLQALMDDLHSRLTEVTIQVDEPGAQVTFQDHVVGVTPISAALLLDAGQGTLRVTKDGYFPYERQITLRGGGTASFDVTLGSVERQARLVVKSRVPGSLISVDDHRLAQAPAEVLLLPGPHRIVAHREGYADASTQIIVDAGQNRSVSLDPLEQHPLLKQWWFWTGVAVVVAAGTTATVLIARDHRAPSDGDFSPSAISAPLGRF